MLLTHGTSDREHSLSSSSLTNLFDDSLSFESSSSTNLLDDSSLPSSSNDHEEKLTRKEMLMMMSSTGDNESDNHVNKRSAIAVEPASRRYAVVVELT